MKPRCIFDLDHTLYNTSMLWERVVEELVERGFEEHRVNATANALTMSGYSFELHLRALGASEQQCSELVPRLYAMMDKGNAYLYPDVVPWITTKAGECDLSLLTFGHQAFQTRKWQALTELHPFFSEFRVVEAQGVTKGMVIASMGNDRPTVFIDDAPRHLVDAQEQAPFATRVRMMRSDGGEPHVGDGVAWRCIRSLKELEHLVGSIS
jgi:FMN phosphatase YigB (HAD superfamily)